MGLENFRKEENFGTGKLHKHLPGFSDLDAQEKALAAAWANACPTPTEFINLYGPQWSGDVYRNYNFLYSRVICELVHELNPSLHDQLIRNVDRKELEFVGVHESGSVPDNYGRQMPPLSTLYGYALTRIFTEVCGRGNERTMNRCQEAIDMFRVAAQVSSDPYELTARFAESAVSLGHDAGKILGRALAKNVMEEQNCLSMFSKMAGAIHKYAPKLSERIGMEWLS